MTLVYPLIPAHQDNIELKYSLRSMQAALPNIDRVIIIGNKPEWITRVEHYPFEPALTKYGKQFNIYEKLQFAFTMCNEFLFCNDDHFINKSFEPEFYYADGIASEKIKIAGNLYQKVIRNAMNHAGGDIVYYDVHCPIMMRRSWFHKKFENAPIGEPPGMLIKSTYANGLQPYFYPDLKVKGYFDPGYLAMRDYFSVADSGLTNYFLFTLEKMWPEKSRFEL